MISQDEIEDRIAECLAAALEHADDEEMSQRFIKYAIIYMEMQK